MDKLSFNWSHSSYCFVKLWLNYGSDLLICDWFLVISFPLRNKTTWKCWAKIKRAFGILSFSFTLTLSMGSRADVHFSICGCQLLMSSHMHTVKLVTPSSPSRLDFCWTGPLLASASKPLPSGTVSKHLSTGMFNFIHLFSVLGTAPIHSLCLCDFS